MFIWIFPRLWSYFKKRGKIQLINFFSILNVSAIVLANLCVSYIMTSQNEEAEELMRKIEKEEEQVSTLRYFRPWKTIFSYEN